MQRRALNLQHRKDLLARPPTPFLGFGKRVFWKRDLFRKVHFLEILENLEILEILENPYTVENKGESDHFLEILEKFRDFRDSRDSSSEKTPFVVTPFPVPIFETSDSDGRNRVIVIAHDRYARLPPEGALGDKFLWSL